VTGPLPSASDAPIRGTEDLLSVFQNGAKPRASWGVGLEYERLGLRAATARAIPYSGDRGVERILREMSDRFGWTPEMESGRIIGLERGDSRVSLEPGGQVELSGRVHRGLDALRREVAVHLEETSEVAGPMGVAFVPTGLQPVSPIEEMEWVPKARYSIMAPYLRSRGALAHHMMKGTAGCQLNFDYAGEEDAIEKIRTAMGITSIVTAAFANSPVYAGGLNGLMTRRAHIWLDTDAGRCGLLEIAFSGASGFRDYMNYALDVPVIFVQRLGRYLEIGGLPFRSFMRDGHQGLRASLSDWILHLTTIFTEVRLKSYIEVRGADSVEPALTVALAALWKGILYDTTSCRRAWALVADVPFEQRIEFHRSICALGPRAVLRGTTAVDLARELVRLASEGLARQAAGPDGAPGSPGEAALLEPLRASLDGEGGCPAARLAARWTAGMSSRPSLLIDDAARADSKFLDSLV
jgi:glutamate--cysteine ligase